jgi:hypothetical protein
MAYRYSGIRIPILEVLVLLQAQELPELVHCAHAPLARLEDTHDLDHAEYTGGPARTVCTGGILSGVE